MLTPRSKFLCAGSLAALMWIALGTSRAPAADALDAGPPAVAPRPASTPRTRAAVPEFEPVPARAAFLQAAAKARPQAVSKLQYDPRQRPADPKTIQGRRQPRPAPGLTAKLLAAPRKSSPPRTPMTIRR